MRQLFATLILLMFAQLVAAQSGLVQCRVVFSGQGGALTYACFNNVPAPPLPACTDISAGMSLAGQKLGGLIPQSLAPNGCQAGDVQYDFPTVINSGGTATTIPSTSTTLFATSSTNVFPTSSTSFPATTTSVGSTTSTTIAGGGTNTIQCRVQGPSAASATVIRYACVSNVPVPACNLSAMLQYSSLFGVSSVSGADPGGTGSVNPCQGSDSQFDWNTIAGTPSTTIPSTSTTFGATSTTTGFTSTTAVSVTTTTLGGGPMPIDCRVLGSYQGVSRNACVKNTPVQACVPAVMNTGSAAVGIDTVKNTMPNACQSSDLIFDYSVVLQAMQNQATVACRLTSGTQNVCLTGTPTPACSYPVMATMSASFMGTLSAVASAASCDANDTVKTFESVSGTNPGGGSSTSTTVTGTTTTTGAGTTTTLAGAGALNFVAGWNLAGNSSTGAIDVAGAFGDANLVTTVWKWIADGAKWAFYAPSLVGQALTDYATSKGYDVLATVYGGEGFWVNAKASFTKPIPSGSAIASASFQSNLLPGWNLIAIGDSKTPRQFNATIGTTPPQAGVVATNLTTLWAWDAAQTNWYFYAPSLDAKGGSALTDYIISKAYLDFGTSVLDPTTGFWVNKP